LDCQNRRIRVRPRRTGKCSVREFKNHREIGSQCLGVFKITGSSIPAFSLFFTTSLYVEPVATILLSSSDNAIQVSSGAVRRSSQRGSGFAVGIR
jgi:hypothetical protein